MNTKKIDIMQLGGLKGQFLCFWVLSWWTSLLCIVGELSWGGSEAVAVSIGERGKMKCDMWHVICDMWYVTCDTWHPTHDMWYVTSDMWHTFLTLKTAFKFRRSHKYLRQLENVRFNLTIYHSGQSTCHWWQNVKFQKSWQGTSE